MDVCNSLRKQRAIDIKIVHVFPVLSFSRLLVEFNKAIAVFRSKSTDKHHASLFLCQLVCCFLLFNGYFSFLMSSDIHVVDNTNYAMFPLPSSFEFLVKYKNAHIRYF